MDEPSGPFLKAPSGVATVKTMLFPCRISTRDGNWTVEHRGPDIGPIRVSAPTREEAMRKMEEEIRYWLEICPCGGQALRNLEIELVEA